MMLQEVFGGGSPLLFFFFHFVLEYGLSRLMNKVIEVNLVLGIHLGKEKTVVYHLQLGDDNLFFSYKKE